MLDEVVLGNGDTFYDVLQVLEYAPSFEDGEPAEWEYKYYAPDFGLIKVEEELEYLGNGEWGNPGLTLEYVGSVSVPEPSTVFLLGAGLLGIAGLGRKKIKT